MSRSRWARRAGVMLAALIVAGCASVRDPAPVAAPPPSLLDDALFAAPSTPTGASDLFTLSDAMKAYLRDRIEPAIALKGRQRALVDALYAQNELKLLYDPATTRTASEAFEARAGNCLSLVVMTAAFARELGLSVNYQKVLTDDAIGRDGDLYFAIGHINLKLGRNTTDEHMRLYRTYKQPYEPDWTTIDFLPAKDLGNVRTITIEESTVVAMYLNNRAVESLARGEVVDAYWWVREAVARDPGYLPAVNTLGVVYARHRDAKEAERALRHVLARDPHNVQAMSNLVGVLADTGRIEESQQLAATLVRIDPEPPFSWYFRGMDALRRDDAEAAKAAFAKEVARAPDFHEFHFWLAVAMLKLGETDEARAELEIALASSTSRRDHDVYASKLARLKKAAETHEN